MSRRDFRTPASVPTESVGRCITVPNSSEWLGLLNAALLMLTEQWRYDQVESTDLTPEDTAALWYDIYVQTLTSACDDCPDMNCNDVLTCILPYLEASYYEDASIRLDPVTDEPQVSYDGGTTWSDIPQSGDGTINAPQPAPTSGANDEAKICLASSRAALVIAELFKQSFGAFTADLYNAIGTANTFLQDVKMILFNAIYSPYDGILETAGFLTQDFETNYTAAELSSGNVEDLLCLLVDNAAVNASSVVTFDYGAARDNIISTVGVNPGTALWFLLGNMQEAGLNAAGSVRITDTALDCSPCGVEPVYSCFTDFRVEAGPYVGENGFVTRVDSEGFRTTGGGLNAIVWDWGDLRMVNGWLVEVYFASNSGYQTWYKDAAGVWQIWLNVSNSGTGTKVYGTDCAAPGGYRKECRGIRFGVQNTFTTSRIRDAKVCFEDGISACP